jgi:hypothetical protein
VKTILSFAFIAAAVMMPAPAATTIGPAAPSSRRANAATTRACRRQGLDARAKQLALTAETAAETIATDEDGSYARVSPAKLHAYEPSIPTTSRRAAGSPERAYVLSASGTPASYSIAVRSLNGNTFRIGRTQSGAIFHAARVCGTVESW